MKHAGPAALAELDALLRVLRQLPMLVESGLGNISVKARHSELNRRHILEQ